MQISIVNYLNLDQGTRLDAEFYKPGFLYTESILKNTTHKLLGDVIKSIKSFGAYALCNEMVLVEKGIPFIRCKDIKDGFVDFSEILYIDEPTHKLLAKSAVNSESVLLTMSGTVGNCAVADPNWKYPINSNQDIAKIDTTNLVNPYYLAVFLNCKYGKTQTARLPVGSIQQHIFLWQLKGLLVFLPSKRFQEIIANLYCNAIGNLTALERAYSQAGQILLAELNLLECVPKRQLSFVKNYSDTQSAERIDAEYFQPMYEEVVTELYKYKNGCCVFADIVKVSDRNFTPRDDVVYKYIELSNISTNGNITGFTEEQGRNLPTRARQIVTKGDVIISSIEGSLESIALINEPLNNALCSTGFYVVNSPKLNPETLLIFLKSQAGQLQLKKGCSGTILTAIGKDELMKIVIPEIDEETQENIKDKIDEMYRSREISKTLLDIAKRGVEMAIELDEVQAQKWIEEKLSAID